MKTRFLVSGLLAFAFTVFLFPLITSGETSPFTLKVTLLKDRIPAGDLLPVAINFTIAPNHHIYRDQVKIESGDPARFAMASTKPGDFSISKAKPSGRILVQKQSGRLANPTH